MYHILCKIFNNSRFFSRKYFEGFCTKSWKDDFLNTDLTKVGIEEKYNLKGILRFKYIKLGIFKQLSLVVINTGPSWLLLVRYPGEEEIY